MSAAAALTSRLKDSDICVSSAAASFPTFVESCLPLRMPSSTGSYAGHSKHYVKRCWILRRELTHSFSRSSTQLGSDLSFHPALCGLWSLGQLLRPLLFRSVPDAQSALGPACSLGGGLLRSLLQYLRVLLECDLCVFFGVIHRHPYLTWVGGEPRGL